MKLKALTLGVALALPALASAQGTNNVTLYGTIDTGIHYINNINTGKDNYWGTTGGLTNSVPSNWGLRGSEKISDNLEALFKLESGFNPNVGTSNQGGRLFGREAWVGLKGDWGQVALGRQYSMLFWSSLNSDILGPNAYGTGSLDAYIPDRRQDNAISYRGTFSGVTAGAMYSKGRNVAGNGCGITYSEQTGCSSYSAMLGYDAANWGVNVAYDVLSGSDAMQGGGLKNGESDKRLQFNAWAKFDALKIGGFYMNRKNGATGGNGIGTNLGDRSDLFSLGAAYALTPAVTIDGAVNYINYKNAVDTSKSWLYVARVQYALSKRTAVYASAAYLNNRGNAANGVDGGSAGSNPAAGNNQTGLMAGLRHRF